MKSTIIAILIVFFHQVQARPPATARTAAAVEAPARPAGRTQVPPPLTPHHSPLTAHLIHAPPLLLNFELIQLNRFCYFVEVLILMLF